jgi:hypothetical protein
MRGFNGGGESARGDRVGFVGEGPSARPGGLRTSRVSPPAPPGFGGLYNRFWFGVLGVMGPRAERVVGSGWESPLAGGLTRPSPTVGKNMCFSNLRFALPANASDRSESAPLIFVSVRKKSVVCFLQLTENLNEPLFRLEGRRERIRIERRNQEIEAGFS